MDDKKIKYNSTEAARYVENIKGWVDINNRFHGDGKDAEHWARYSSCTHMICECGNEYKKGWGVCSECRDKKELENYYKLDFKEYDGSVVYSKLLDKYFFDENELIDYLYNEDYEIVTDLRLVLCKENYFNELESDYFEDVLPEDGDLPEKLQEAIDELNNVIKQLPCASYSPINIRTEYISKFDNK